MNQVNGLNDLLSDEEFLAELRQESSEGSELERQQFSELLDKLARRLSELAGEGGEPPPPEDRPKG
jgi:hypothetical protein